MQLDAARPSRGVIYWAAREPRAFFKGGAEHFTSGAWKEDWERGGEIFNKQIGDSLEQFPQILEERGVFGLMEEGLKAPGRMAVAYGGALLDAADAAGRGDYAGSRAASSRLVAASGDVAVAYVTLKLTIAGAPESPGSVVLYSGGAIAGEGGALLRRPYIRKPVRLEVERRAPRTPDGKLIDPNTWTVIEGKPDFGHKPGHEHRVLAEDARRRGLSQSEFNDEVNNPDIFQLEDLSNNRSRRFEQK